jgi:hypothetical protein
MLEVISTVATVTSTVLQWLDYSRNRRESRLDKTRSYRIHETQQVVQVKVEALASELWRSQRQIVNGFWVSAVICFATAVFTFFVLSSIIPSSIWFFPVELWEAPDWIIVAASAFTLLTAVVIAYGVMVGIARFLIERKLQYYSFSQDSFFQLKLVVEKLRWRNRFVKWFIQEVLLQVERSGGVHK